ncbi:MAG: response regulator [Bacteroidales bacterium]|nr:response regulator [Bacteroidales bacterium]
MKKILIVDDSEVNLLLIQSIFEDDPEIQVQIESESTNALADMRENRPDLLILDLMMPHIDGFQLLQRIKAEPSLAEIPVMVISARHDTEAIEKVRQFGVEDYITKPVDLEIVATNIRSILKLGAV